MNKTELLAYDWLQKQGYTGVVFQRHHSPDFLTAEGVGFEVKKARNGVIFFTDGQWDSLSRHPDVRVVIFDDTEEPLAIAEFSELVEPPSFWHQFRLTMSLLWRNRDIARTERLEQVARGDVSLYTIQEVMNILGVADETIYRHIRKGKIKAIRVGGLWRISSEALDEFLKKGEQNNHDSNQ